MNAVFELELHSQPGLNLSQEFGKDLKLKIDSDLGLDDSLVVGLSYLPDATDSENLKLSIEEHEIYEIDFMDYCVENGLEADVMSHMSASKFIEYSFGRPLAWLHIPHNEHGLISYTKILDWASANGYNVQCGHGLYCLLPCSNNMPIGW